MQAINRPFHEIVNGNTQFFIPVFQRDYSWEEEHCLKLWEDLLMSAQKEGNYGHFIGSIVYVDSRDTLAGFTRWMVIDGQQRFTTLTILLIALRDFIRKHGIKGNTYCPSADQIETDFLKNMYGSDEKKRKLLLRRTDDGTLAALIEGSPTPQVSSKKILEAYALFTELIETKESGIIYQGIHSLNIVDVRLDTRYDDPQLVFESLNSTGVDLSQADLIRNFVLMRLTENDQTRVYENYWRKIENLFSANPSALDDFARDFLAIRTGTRVQTRSDQIYQDFKQWFLENALNSGAVETLLSDMLRLAGYYSAFRLGTNVQGRLGDALKHVSRLAEAPAILITTLYQHYEDTSSLSESEFIEAIQVVESYLMRRAVCGFQTRGYWSVFAGISTRISANFSVEQLKTEFAKLSENVKFPSDEEFKDSLINNELYRLRVCRHILERLENADTRELSDTSEYSIEHVLPQNRKLSNEWKKMLGEDWQEIHDTFVHRLGNLTLTAYNSTYSDRPFIEKKTIRGGFNESAVRLNRYIRDQDVWTKKEIVRRGLDLTSKCLDIWAPLNIDPSVIRQAQFEDLREQARLTNPEQVEMTNFAKELFNELRAHILGFGTGRDIVELTDKRTISYHSPDFFLEIIPRKSHLTLILPLDYAEINDPHGIATDMNERKFVMYASNDGGVVVTFETINDVYKIIPLIEQSLSAIIG